MMNGENSDTDLGLALCYSNKSVRTRLNNNSGAGVNAGSRIDTKFVASDPLSELVWSPHKGLSLKCAGSSLTYKKPSALCNVGPSNMVLSPSHSIRSRGTNDDEPINEGNLIESEAAFHVDTEVAKGATLAKSSRGSGTGGNMEKVNTVEGVSVVHFNQKEDYQMENEDQGLCSPKNIEFALASEVQTMKQCETVDNLVSNLPSLGRKPTELALVIEDTKNKMKMHSSTSVTILEKLEFTAENDVHHLICKDACGQSEERLRRKSKEKGLSVRDVNETVSKDEDNSHESVESCNSAGLFSRGKKRWSFEQQLIGGTKRIKKQVQESPASTSLVRPDSSFMNWISNMVKGLPKSNQDEGPCLALTFDHLNHGRESYDQKTIACNKIHDSGSRNMGFQNIFQSLYCPNTKVLETKMSNDNYSEGGSKELVLADKTLGPNITPISFCGEKDKFCKQFLVSNDDFNQSISGSGGNRSTQTPILSANFAATQETCKANSAENRTLSNLACTKTKDGGLSSDSSPSKQMADSPEKKNLDPPSEAKGIHNMGYGSDHLGSLWITRFYPKTPCQSTHVMLECSTDCTRLIPQNHGDFPIDKKSSRTRKYSSEEPVNVVDNELKNYVPSTEASIGFKRRCGHNYQEPVFRLNSIPPSQTFQSTEAMASVFARRLDALKHIKPSSVKNDAIRTRKTCFFCGRTGHDLRDCSEVKETELVDLLKNISSYDGEEESPCLCIRCFRLDHWAISCPVESSSRHHQSEHGASMVSHYDADKGQLNESHSNILETKECHPEVTGQPIICNVKKPLMDTDISSNPIWNGKMLADKMISSSGEEELKENQITPLCKFVSKQLSDAPKRMFEIIKKLHLSRMDILKWINSHGSLSHLEGFFLRLRLGKWEEGLGGAGYYVACINGMQREKTTKYSKNLLSVSVGGIKCLVESQYVSNHDFLEDELMAWWSTTSKSGKIPTEEDLKSKLEEKKKLGF